jgi:adenine-specific DNA-methyltransferase
MPKKTTIPRAAKSYKHADKDAAMRPEVGTQARFTKKLPPKTYHYDSSLSPALDYDGQNHAREMGEWLLKQIEEASRLPAPHTFKDRREFKTADGKIACSVAGLQDAVAALKALSKPFLNWAGKAERLSFDVPTLPLFVHERLSTKAILETLKGHKRDKQMDMLDLFGDPQHPIADQVLRAYEHRDKWVNRMILGDSLAVMNSLLRYESLGGQVQMIYMDPPYGVKFGSNFQPFVRKRDVGHGDDEDMTREPEMVQAYRDTWELGLHSYLTYLRDRLLLARDLLHPSGSIFVQISEANAHHVRELLDEIFGPDNFFGDLVFFKAGSLEEVTLPRRNDYILWYCRDVTRMKFRRLYKPKEFYEETEQYNLVQESNGTNRRISDDERRGASLPSGARIFRYVVLTKPGPGQRYEVEFEGKKYSPGTRWWGFPPESMEKLIRSGRIAIQGNSLASIRYLDDFPVTAIDNVWTDTATGSGMQKLYVVQTATKAIERCLQMTTGPGDLVLDPTCGSGTTAYVAEQWGRRWITIDASRVPLALARQRLLTATYPWYELQDEARGPASGFVYKRKQNKKGEEVGGIVPHVTLKSIANNEPPEEEVLVDRPEENSAITRVTGAFCFEATLPVASGDEAKEEPERQAGMKEDASFADRMLEVLRRSPMIRLPGNKTINLKNIRPPAKTLSLSAEAMTDVTANGKATLGDAMQEAKEKNGQSLPLSQKPVAIVFGPENAAVSERLINEASREAYQKGYAHLYVIGFQIEPSARLLVEKNAEMGSIPATYVQATTDLTMGDLLKNMRSSQIFSVCGMPEVKLTRLKTKKDGDGAKYQAALIGLDVFDPVTMDVDHKTGNDVPAWFLDTNYNGLCFHVSQAFFPKTGAWESLKKALKAEYSETVWDHLAGNVSTPFELAKGQQIAVKVIDDRGNELMVVKSESEAEPE